MDLSIIIISYNTVDLIVNCLNSINSDDDVIKEVFVVDNASTDGSAAIIQRTFPAVHLIVNSDNRGFAAANNQVLSQCEGRYFFFLNPDTIVMPGVFKTAISYMESNTCIGLAGTKIVNPDGSLQDSVSYRYPGEKYTRGELSGLKGSIACVLGASMIARSNLIGELGGFDDKFFIYGEDQDLCLRIRKLGYEIGYIESAVVVHFGGQSERQSTSAELWKKKVTAEHLFYRKHYRFDTFSCIRRADMVKAYWRIFTLGMTMPFIQDKARAREKLVKYKIYLRSSSIDE